MNELTQKEVVRCEAVMHDAVAMMNKLSDAEIAYAADAARGAHWGFSALHDLFDANTILPGYIRMEAEQKDKTLKPGAWGMATISYDDATVAQFNWLLCAMRSCGMLADPLPGVEVSNPRYGTDIGVYHTFVVRACQETKGQVEQVDYSEQSRDPEEDGTHSNVFFSLYGQGAMHLEECIGDFDSFEHACDVLRRIVGEKQFEVFAKFSNTEPATKETETKNRRNHMTTTPRIPEANEDLTGKICVCGTGRLAIVTGKTTLDIPARGDEPTKTREAWGGLGLDGKGTWASTKPAVLCDNAHEFHDKLRLRFGGKLSFLG